MSSAVAVVDFPQPVTISGPLDETFWAPGEASRAAPVSKGVIAAWAHRGYLVRVNAKSARTPLYRASEVLAAEYAVRCRRQAA
ncbi:hypothetical protein [Kitasatospora sp. NPDC001175]|uniref:hypothetical protein n=1 Tax=Kitasatospora sp. NPDC001175 TaxID=3157103 RepID=UPI003D084274